MKSFSTMTLLAFCCLTANISFAENRAATSELPASLAALGPSATHVVTQREASAVRGQGTLLIGKGAILDFLTYANGYEVSGQVAGKHTSINSVYGDVTAKGGGKAYITVADQPKGKKHQSGSGLITSIAGVYKSGHGDAVYVRGGASGTSVHLDATHGYGLSVSTHGKAKQQARAASGYIRANTGTFTGEMSFIGNTDHVHVNTYRSFSAQLKGVLPH